MIFLFVFTSLTTVFAASKTLPLMPVSTQFQYTVGTDGSVAGSELKLTNQNGNSSFYTTGSVFIKPLDNPDPNRRGLNISAIESGQGTGSIEVITNSGKIPKTVIAKDSGVYFVDDKTLSRERLSVVQLGAGQKVLSHTQCWENTQCFTVTPELCSDLAEKLGAKSIEQATDDAKACIKMSVAFDKALGDQGSDYYAQHRGNLEILTNSQTVTSQNSTIKNYYAKLKSKIGASKSPYKDLASGDTVDTRPMRMYELLLTCSHYQRAGAFTTVGASNSLQSTVKQKGTAQ